MIILGGILLIIGIISYLPVLQIIGIVLLVVGLALLILGQIRACRRAPKALLLSSFPSIVDTSPARNVGIINRLPRPHRESF